MKWLVVMAAHGPPRPKRNCTQVFTEDGRKYMKGSKAKRCGFAYLENRRIGESDGRLIFRAKFSGRSAMTPCAEKSLLQLREVEVTSDSKPGMYVVLQLGLKLTLR